MQIRTGIEHSLVRVAQQTVLERLVELHQQLPFAEIALVEERASYDAEFVPVCVRSTSQYQLVNPPDRAKDWFRSKHHNRLLHNRPRDMTILLNQLTRLELAIAADAEDGAVAQLAVLWRLEVKVGEVLLRHMCAIRESEEGEQASKFRVCY